MIKTINKDLNHKHFSRKSSSYNDGERRERLPDGSAHDQKWMKSKNDQNHGKIPPGARRFTSVNLNNF